MSVEQKSLFEDVNEQDTLFDNVVDQDSLFDKDNDTKGNIIVYDAKLTGKDSYNWMDLFTGYTDLKAITFSSSLYFLEQIVPLFNKVELLFGNERVLGDLTDIFTYQSATTECIKTAIIKKKNKKLLNMLDQDRLEVFLCQKKLSHKKIYLLANEDEGKYRVIFGSANLSKTAFEGIQGELICKSDDVETYKMLLDNYTFTKLDAFKRLVINAQDLSLNPVDIIKEAPLLQTEKHIDYAEIHVNKELDHSQDDKEQKNYVDIEHQWENLVKAANVDIDTMVKPDKNKINLQLLKVTKKAALIEKVASKENEKKQVGLPILLYNRKLERMEYNEKEFLLDYNLDKAKEDAKILMEVFDTYNKDNFKAGDVEDARVKYFAIFNYMAMAPFLSVARQYAVKRRTGISGENFPLHLVLFGGSGAGKTWMIKFFQQLFFNSSFLISVDEASPQKLMKARYAAAGFPLVIDDCSKKRWDDYKGNIKIDSYNSENVSPLLITTNDTLTFEPQYEKRVIILKLSTISEAKKAIQKNVFVKRFDDISGDFYRMYLQRMTELLPFYLDKLDNSDKFSVEDLDFFKLASQCMVDLLGDLFDNDLPEFMKAMSLEWYLIQAVNDEKKRDILLRYQNTPENFIVNKKENKLVVKTTDQHEMNRLTKNFSQLLIIGKGNQNDPFVVFDYKEAQKYFGISFRKKKWWEIL